LTRFPYCYHPLTELLQIGTTLNNREITIPLGSTKTRASRSIRIKSMRHEDYKNNFVEREDNAIIQKSTSNHNKMTIRNDQDLFVQSPQSQTSGRTVRVHGDSTTTDTPTTKIVEVDEQQDATIETKTKCDVFLKTSQNSFIQRKNCIDQKRNEILKFAESLRGDFQKLPNEFSSSNHSYSHNNKDDGGGNSNTTKHQVQKHTSSFWSSHGSLSSFYDDDDDDDTDSITSSYIDYNHDDDDHTTVSNMMENFLLSSSMTLEDIQIATDDDIDDDSFDDSLANLFTDSFSFCGSDNEGHTTDDEKDADSFVILEVERKTKPHSRTYGLDTVLNTIVDDIVPHVIQKNNEVQQVLVRSTR